MAPDVMPVFARRHADVLHEGVDLENSDAVVAFIERHAPVARSILSIRIAEHAVDG